MTSNKHTHTKIFKLQASKYKNILEYRNRNFVQKFRFRECKQNGLDNWRLDL